MKTIPMDIGPIHFVGIGGIGMSGIAELMHSLGYRVQGSDRADGANVRRLVGKGIPVTIGHGEANLGDAQVVVISSAVKADNPEVAAARRLLIPVVRRAEMLGELMRLKWSIAVGGTHGKTTTTSLVAQVLDAAGLDPTVVNGGIINAWGSNARHGSGDWMVAEADESDGTMVKLPATIAVITNIDPEHLDHYGTFEALREAFVTFAANIPFYGIAALCVDHPEVQGILPRLLDRRVVTYGFSPQADVRGIDVRANGEGVRFSAVITDRKTGASRTVANLFLPMFGRHNVQNALAALAVAGAVGIDDAVVARAFSTFGGVNRRFTRCGDVDGIAIIDDYGHHPVEIAAVLAAARTVAKGQVIAVVQPHRYSRLQNLFEGFCSCFNDADVVVVADVYPAGEDPIAGVDRDALVDGLRARGHRRVLALADRGDLATTISELAYPGDLVVCLGAGNISQWAHALAGEVTELRRGRAGAAA
ncbi:MAG: UDP-N-acetylmuramate--L-alanine ligase [Rhodospirillales bacterium]|nr:UDP-N-acetylmuramate--L-alanine ligase [Rhodospirillales bacterium]